MPKLTQKHQNFEPWGEALLGTLNPQIQAGRFNFMEDTGSTWVCGSKFILMMSEGKGTVRFFSQWEGYA